MMLKVLLSFLALLVAVVMSAPTDRPPPFMKEGAPAPKVIRPKKKASRDGNLFGAGGRKAPQKPKRVRGDTGGPGDPGGKRGRFFGGKGGKGGMGPGNPEKRSEMFLKKFDKMVADSDLPEEELNGFREELRGHSNRRLELATKRRELVKAGKDAPGIKAELDVVDKELKTLNEAHREIFSKVKGKGKGPDINPPGGWSDRLRKGGGKKEGRPKPNAKDYQERRKKSIQERTDKMWAAAQEADFDEEELVAIKEELDEFTAKELALIDQYPLDMPIPNQKPKPDRKGRRNPETIKEMKELRQRRADLEKRIREKKEL